MKIKKLVESRIIEAAEDEESLADINPITASVDKIADGIQADVEKATDGEATMSEPKADAIAQEIKDVATEVGAERAAVIPEEEVQDEYVTENMLTRVLDRALANSKRFMRRGDTYGANILVSGLPGSGKTAIVKTWAKKAGVFLYPVNAKNQKLETAIDGMPMRVTGTDEVAFLPTDLLKPIMQNDNVVMFLDEYNRQTNPQVRGALLTLINEKMTADGKQDFSKHLLFTVACINPSVRSDKGAAQLNDAERSRFIWNLADFDSDVDTSLNYFATNAANRLSKLGIKVPTVKGIKKYDPAKDPTANMTDAEKKAFYDKNDVEEEIKIYALADYIMDNSNHPMAEFKFDDREDLDTLNDEQKNLLNSRLMTDALRNTGGDPAEFLDWVDNYSNLLDKDKNMFHEILDFIPEDYLDPYKQQFGLDISKPDAAPVEDTVDVEDDADIEDDTTAFQQQVDASGNATALDPNGVVDDINTVSAGW